MAGLPSGGGGVSSGGSDALVGSWFAIYQLNCGLKYAIVSIIKKQKKPSKHGSTKQKFLGMTKLKVKSTTGQPDH